MLRYIAVFGVFVLGTIAVAESESRNSASIVNGGNEDATQSISAEAEDFNFLTLESNRAPDASDFVQPRIVEDAGSQREPIAI